jgi:hypothetical protein
MPFLRNRMRDEMVDSETASKIAAAVSAAVAEALKDPVPQPTPPAQVSAQTPPPVGNGQPAAAKGHRHKYEDKEDGTVFCTDCLKHRTVIDTDPKDVPAAALKAIKLAHNNKDWAACPDCQDALKTSFDEAGYDGDRIIEAIKKNKA